MRTRWEELAEAGGYGTEKEFWEGEYKKCGSIKKLERSLGISSFTVRKKFHEFNITLQARGGPRNVKVVFTERMLQEINVNGLKRTAEKMGVAQFTLVTARKKFLLTRPDLAPPPKPSPQSEAPAQSESEQPAGPGILESILKGE